MNRVTRLIHKARFLSRQRNIISYSHRYVITSDDLARQEKSPLQTIPADKSSEEAAKMIEDLVGDFDPENNETDRLIFYEVTGRQMIRGEFDEEDSSENDWLGMTAHDPLHHAFAYSD